MSRDKLHSYQLGKLNRLLRSLCNHPLYRDKLSGLSTCLQTMEELSGLPILTKHEMIGASAGEPSKLFTMSRHHYTRYHQTSGSRGWPMPVLDTAEDWAWWIECWQYVLDAANVTRDDVAMMAFSFGPFIGFWSANDALVSRGVLVVPGGGLSSVARLKLMQDQACTVLCCTPTYALHLACVAAENGIDLKQNSISRIIVAGEPGGSVPSVREAIQSQWSARVVDHAGASELGAWGFASEHDSGLQIIESEFIAEFLQFDANGNVIGQLTPGTSPAPEKAKDSMNNTTSLPSAELVMTNLGRFGGPVLRYRTGDIVRPVWDHDFECRFVHLSGGVLGRADDMLVIRGVNVFPSSIESIVREVEPVAEFRTIATRVDEMDQLRIEIESDDADRWLALETLLRERLTLRILVSIVEPGTLPRSEGKSNRWVDHRHLIHNHLATAKK